MVPFSFLERKIESFFKAGIQLAPGSKYTLDDLYNALGDIYE